MLREAKRLYDLGFAVHWIKPNSKAPVKAGWSGPKRDDWATVKADYRKGYGLGVRMGESSRLPDGTYLANIDVDVKGGNAEYVKAGAFEVMDRSFPGVRKSAPFVRTGHGLRYFVRTKAPAQSGKLGQSPKECVVLLPTTEINRRQRQAVQEGKLNLAQLEDGYRVRPAWEVEFMSTGKQVVLPPSIHPETETPYTWAKALTAYTDMPLVKAPVTGAGKAAAAPEPAASAFQPVKIDLARLSQRVRDQLIEGSGVTDRSAACFGVALAMLRAKYSDQEIMTVLTDRGNALGETAYEHAQTKKRSRAAAWVLRYCISKARDEVSAAKAFSEAVTVTPVLEPEAAKAQRARLVSPALPGDWKKKLARSKQGGVQPTLKNTVTVLMNAGAPGVFRRDLFSCRDFYGCSAPWGGVEGEALTDDDAVKIKHWLGKFYGFEPNTGTIYEAMVWIATRNSFHPIRDELEALPDWDLVPRLDGWLKKYFGAKGPEVYLAQVFRKWLVASVARTFEPGLKFDWIPILEGMQGTGKSSFGAILFGQRYFSDWLPQLQDKDAALGLQGKRCVEFGELDQLRRNELETIKAFVTRQVDNVRPPYGKRSIEIYRQTVFFGTTNKDKYLKDETGNRRFNPVKVGRLDFPALARDRAQLWAEALWIYRNGLEPVLDLDNGAVAHARQIQAEKMVEDESSFMLEAFREFVEVEQNKPESQFNFFKFKLVPLFKSGGPFQKWPENGRNAQFAATALRAAGAERRSIKGIQWWKLGEEG